ncbi:MAG TPA: phosphatase PAP2 family protein [Polyangia bacterium]|nr:phosphatase PAP2 family protein [Polyangia bacterium]
MSLHRALLFAIATLLARPAAAGGDSPYRLRLDIDLPLLALGTTLWAGSSFVSNAPPPSCGAPSTPACDVTQVNALDRSAIYYNPSLRGVATGVGLVPVAFLLIPFIDAGPRHWRSWLTDFVVIAEALAWDGAVQDVVRRAVRRPRPFLYLDGAGGFERTSAEATFSFYSGHTSFAFTLATSVAFTFQLRHPRSRWCALVWTALLSVATIEPILRVLAGDHFPTDVIVGALTGSAFGVLLPALHRKTGVLLGGSADGRQALLTLSVRL